MAEALTITRHMREVLITLRANGSRLYHNEIARHLPDILLYPALHTLEEGGWITSSWHDMGDFAPGLSRPRYYALTDFGRHAAQSPYVEEETRNALLGRGMKKIQQDTVDL